MGFYDPTLPIKKLTIKKTLYIIKLEYFQKNKFQWLHHSKKCKDQALVQGGWSDCSCLLIQTISKDTGSLIKIVN